MDAERRAEKWANATAIADAILEARIVNNLAIEASQIKGPSDFMCPIYLRVGLGESKYDELRSIVNEHGGTVIVLDEGDRNPGYTIRIWP